MSVALLVTAPTYHPQPTPFIFMWRQVHGISPSLPVQHDPHTPPIAWALLTVDAGLPTPPLGVEIYMMRGTIRLKTSQTGCGLHRQVAGLRVPCEPGMVHSNKPSFTWTTEQFGLHQQYLKKIQYYRFLSIGNTYRRLDQAMFYYQAIGSSLAGCLTICAIPWRLLSSSIASPST